MCTHCRCWVAKSCLTLCNPMDCSPPGSSIHGISQTRKLEWVSISCSRGSSWLGGWTPHLLTSPAWTGCFFTTEPPGKAVRLRISLLSFPLKSPQIAEQSPLCHTVILINGLLYTYWCWWWSSLWGVSKSCHPMDCSLPGSSVHGIFQARILEWVATSFSIYIQYHDVTCQSQSPNSSEWTLERSSGAFSLSLASEAHLQALQPRSYGAAQSFQFFGQFGLTQPSMGQTSYFWQNSLKHFLVSFQADVFQRFSRWVSFAVTGSEKPNCHSGLYALKIESLLFPWTIPGGGLVCWPRRQGWFLTHFCFV